MDKNVSLGMSIEDALKKVRKWFENIKYGEITLKVEKEKAIWVDKLREKGWGNCELD